MTVELFNLSYRHRSYIRIILKNDSLKGLERSEIGHKLIEPTHVRSAGGSGSDKSTCERTWHWFGARKSDRLHWEKLQRTEKSIFSKTSNVRSVKMKFRIHEFSYFMNSEDRSFQRSEINLYRSRRRLLVPHTRNPARIHSRASSINLGGIQVDCESN